MTCPLLMLWGEKNSWIGASSRVAKFRQYYPKLTEYHLKAGHCAHDEIPEEVNKLIHSWILSVNDRSF